MCHVSFVSNLALVYLNTPPNNIIVLRIEIILHEKDVSQRCESIPATGSILVSSSSSISISWPHVELFVTIFVKFVAQSRPSKLISRSNFRVQYFLILIFIHK
jgi:hypothetical protein